MISISVKFAPPTMMFLSPPPLAPAAALELEELDDENAPPAPPQAARSRPTAPTTARAPRRRRRNRGGVEVLGCRVAVISGRLLCPVLLARVSGGLVVPQRGGRPPGLVLAARAATRLPRPNRSGPRSASPCESQFENESLTRSPDLHHS